MISGALCRLDGAQLGICRYVKYCVTEMTEATFSRYSHTPDGFITHFILFLEESILLQNSMANIKIFQKIT